MAACEIAPLPHSLLEGALMVSSPSPAARLAEMLHPQVVGVAPLYSPAVAHRFDGREVKPTRIRDYRQCPAIRSPPRLESTSWGRSLPSLCSSWAREISPRQTLSLDSTGSLLPRSECKLRIDRIARQASARGFPWQFWSGPPSETETSQD